MRWLLVFDLMRKDEVIVYVEFNVFLSNGKRSRLPPCHVQVGDNGHLVGILLLSIDDIFT